RVACLHGPGPYSSPLRVARAHAQAERAAHLLPGLDARALRHLAEGCDAARGGAHPGSGRVHPRARPGAGRRPAGGGQALSRLRRALVARLGAVLRLDDPPWQVALALAIGVFISCTPFWGLQTVLSLAVATIFRLNRAVTVTGAWLNLP